jgi:hypothetical protein
VVHKYMAPLFVHFKLCATSCMQDYGTPCKKVKL